ncbi:TPA: hypothetical protein ACSB0Y_000039 [Acinetobacter baumannii]|uniref:hypothetical protein n=1 Tax=Acinetobacter baumannii TaxID=470 RepID=UPI003A8B0473
MSEFKVGDKVVLKSSSQNKVMTIQESYKEFIRAYWDKEHYSFAHKVNFRFAEDEEISAGHRIDIPTLPKPIGSLQELHPEFAKVLNENFLELISDDSYTENRIGRIDKPSDSRELETLDKPENHISPNCKVEDV